MHSNRSFVPIMWQNSLRGEQRIAATGTGKARMPMSELNFPAIAKSGMAPNVRFRPKANISGLGLLSTRGALNWALPAPGKDHEAGDIPYR
jgi:hypothetical protein